MESTKAERGDVLPAENKSEERKQELNKTIDDFSLFDDDFMSVVFNEILKQQNFC